MELRSVADIPGGPGWQYEPKWDGFRCIAQRDGDTIELASKNGRPLARYFPEVVRALADLRSTRFIVDGELVVPVAGALSFDALQQRIHPAASRVTLLARTTPAFYLTFDLLALDGSDFTTQPLAERRKQLEDFAHSFPSGGRLRLSPATSDRGIVEGWFRRVGGALDGVVAKRIDLPYRSGTRDGGVKVKQVRTADCVVGGFRYTASREAVASLLLGLYDTAGRLDYVGFCSAFSDEERRLLIGRLMPYLGVSGFSGNAPGETESRWSRGERDRSYVALRPELVLEVAFDQVTGGRIRHGTRPLRWRTDKSPSQCTADQLDLSGSALELVD